jgi:hypothetical protein
VQATLDRATRIPLRLLSEPRNIGEQTDARALVERPICRALAGAPDLAADVASRAAYELPAFLLLLLPLGRMRSRPGLLLPYLWMLGCLGLVLGMDLVRSTRQLEFIRYVLPAGPAVYLLIPASVAGLWRPVRYVLPVLAVLFGVSQLGKLDLPRNEDWPGLARVIAASPDAPVVLLAPQSESWFAAATYAGVSHYAYSPTRPWVYLDKPPRRDIVEQLRGPEPVWVISSGGADVERLLPGWGVKRIADVRGVGTLSRARLAATTQPAVD